MWYLPSIEVWRGHMASIPKFAGLMSLAVFTPECSLAQAQAFSFKGKYIETVTGQCINSRIIKRGIAQPNSGFDRNLKPKGKVFKFVIDAQKIRTFNGDGTGSVSHKSVNAKTVSQEPMLRKRFSRPNFTMSHDFTYTVNNHGEIRIEMVPGTFTGHVANDNSRLSGLSFTVDQRVLIGKFSKQGRALTLRSGKPSIETVKYSNGDVVQRICEWTHRVVLNI